VRFAAAWRARHGGALAPRVLDYGCGVGDTAPLLASAFGAASVVGVDRSARCVDAARARHPGHRFVTDDAFAEVGFDVAYVNGVFHHVPVPERVAVARAIRRALLPGGLFFLFENNPWNPGTRFIMSRCRFDDDAVLLWPRQARRVLRAAGFDVLDTAYLFVFPRPLSALRPLEPSLARLPVGAQYVVVARASKHRTAA
jgi:SAM-dependent methyltransferase